MRTMSPSPRDVYKRQVLYPVISAAYKLLREAGSAKVFLEGQENFLRHTVPVSYTHLDVYKRQDLLSMGWTCPIDVLPILIPFEEDDAPWDTAVQSLYRDKKVNVLFTGRVAPNKDVYKRQGVENLVVVDTPDVTLVCGKDNAQDVKKIVEKLRAGGQTQYL